MARGKSALGGGQTVNVEEAFHVSAHRVVGVQLFLLLAGQADGHRDLDLAVCREGQHAAVKALQEQIGVIGVDFAVTVQIGVFGVMELRANAGHIVQQSLGIFAVYDAVTIEVHIANFGLGPQGLAVHSPLHIGTHGGGPDVQEVDALVVKVE